MPEPAGVGLTPGESSSVDTPPASSSPARIGGVIVRGSGALSISLLVSAAGGALYWVLAARLASSETVGRVATMSSVMSVLTLITATVLIPTVARYGWSNDQGQRVLHNLLLVGSAAANVALAAAIVLVASLLEIEQLDVIRTLGGALVFGGVAVGAAWTSLVEIRLLGRMRYHLVVGRAISATVLSLVLVSLGAFGTGPIGLFVAGPGIVALSGPVLWLVAERGVRGRTAVRPLPDDFGSIARFAVVSSVGSLIARVAPTVLPLVVALRVSSDEYGSFYLSWSIALVLYLVVQSVGTSLLAGVRADSEIGKSVRFGVGLALGLGAILTAAAIGAAPLVEVVFGPDYADAVSVVRVLALAIVPVATTGTTVAAAMLRSDRRVILGLPLVSASVVMVGLVATAGTSSVISAAYVWLIGSACTGLIAALILIVRTGN